MNPIANSAENQNLLDRFNYFILPIEKKNELDQKVQVRRCYTYKSQYGFYLECQERPRLLQLE